MFLCSRVGKLRGVLLPKECKIHEFHHFSDIFKWKKILSEPVHSQNDIWSLIREIVETRKHVSAIGFDLLQVDLS